MLLLFIISFHSAMLWDSMSRKICVYLYLCVAYCILKYWTQLLSLVSFEIPSKFLWVKSGSLFPSSCYKTWQSLTIKATIIIPSYVYCIIKCQTTLTAFAEAGGHTGNHYTNIKCMATVNTIKATWIQPWIASPWCSKGSPILIIIIFIIEGRKQSPLSLNQHAALRLKSIST